MNRITAPCFFALALLLLGCPDDGSGNGDESFSFGTPAAASDPPDVGGGTPPFSGTDTSGFGTKPDASAEPGAEPGEPTPGPESPEPSGSPDTAEPEGTDATTSEPDVPFNEPEPSCTPDCDAKECGNDGCGSICGYCEYGKACNDTFACVPVCDPVTPCAGKSCGPDGCGGTCGDCDPSFACGSDGLCYPSECEPQCDGLECGPDTCGGVCGKCEGLKLCDTDIGTCVSNPCGNVSFKGACADAATLIECIDQELSFTDCSLQNPTFGCTWDPIAAKYECSKPPDCTPDCTNKQCGDGGCSYSCGECFGGWSCIDFQCVPEAGGACGTVPTIGQCINNKLYFCSQGLIYIEDCEAAGKTCKFDTNKGKTVCQ